MQYGIAPPDFPDAVTVVKPDSPCTTLLVVARKVALSFFAIMKYEMSWYIWLEKHLLHQQYTTNP
jgi:hypothetical protein